MYDGRSHAARVAFLRDRLFYESCGKAGHGGKQGTIESKRMAGAGDDEPDNADTDGKMDAVLKKVKNTGVQDMPPDMPVRMFPVVFCLIIKSFPVIG